MTMRQYTAKGFGLAIFAFLLIAAMPSISDAQTTTSGGLTSLPSQANFHFIDSATGLRSMRAAPGMNSDGTPSAAYQGNPGCNQNVMSSMSNVANFHYGQNVAIHVNTRILPNSFSSCLTDLIQKASDLNDIFADGFSFSNIINVAFKTAQQGLLDHLENQACQDVESAVHGVLGKVNKNYTLLNAGGIVVSMNPANQLLVCPSGSTMMKGGGPCCAQGSDPNTGQPYLTTLSNGDQTCNMWTAPVQAGNGQPVSP